MADFLEKAFAAAKRKFSEENIQPPGSSTLTVSEVKALGLDVKAWAQSKKGRTVDDLSPEQFKELHSLRLKAHPE